MFGGFADFALIAMSMRGGEKSEIGESRFWECSLTRSPPKISIFER